MRHLDGFVGPISVTDVGEAAGETSAVVVGVGLVGRRSRRAHEVLPRHAVRQRHGLRARAAPGPDAREPDGGAARQVHGHARGAGRGRTRRSRPITSTASRPGKYLSISGRTLRLTEPVETGSVRMPIDFFLRSLARTRRSRRSGSSSPAPGTDGTLGLRAIKAAGGLTIAQDPATAEHDGMPRSAIGRRSGRPRPLPGADARRPARVPAASRCTERRRPCRRGATSEPDGLDDVLAVAARADAVRLPQLQAKHARASHRSPHGLDARASASPDYARLLIGRSRGGRRAVRRSPDQRDELLPRSRGVARSAGAGDSTAGRTQGRPRRAARLGPRLRDRRGGLLDRHAAHRGAAGRAGRPAPSRSSRRTSTRARSTSRAPASTRRASSPTCRRSGCRRFFVDGGPRRSRHEGAARVGGVRAAEPAGGSTVLQARPDQLPQRPHVLRAGGPAADLLAAALRARRGTGISSSGPPRRSARQEDLFEVVSKKWRIYRRVGPTRHDRVRFPARSRIRIRPARSTRRRRPPGRRTARRARPAAAARALRPGVRADQPQVRDPVLRGTDAGLSASSRPASPPRT